MTRVPKDPTSVPMMFWPVMAASALFESGLDLAARNLKFMAEEPKLNSHQTPTLATRARSHSTCAP